MAFWEESAVAGGGFSYVAKLRLAGKHAERGDKDGMLHLLESIQDDSPGAWAKHALLGDVLVHEGRTMEAAAAYERALEINAAQRRIRRELIRIYAEPDPEKAEQHAQDLTYIESFWSSPQ